MKTHKKVATAYVLIGLPASGKSTWRKAHCQDFVIASTDDYIFDIANQKGTTYDDVYTAELKNAESNLQKTVTDAVTNRKDLVWDQTNLTRGKREYICRRLPPYYKKIAVFFDVDMVEIERRLAERNKTGIYISRRTISRLMEYYSVPSLDEGFDELIIVGADGN